MISLAVWKFASCDGCQLAILNCEKELLALKNILKISYFLEASSAYVEGPYDLSFVEGSITSKAEIEKIKMIREKSKAVIAIGACATSGGIQALKNFKNVDDFMRTVYTNAEYIDTIATSKPISDYVTVDYELQGCAIESEQLLNLIKSVIYQVHPRLNGHSVCTECKLNGTTCVLVANNTPCLGPVTVAGCGAACPACNRGCYGCFGPKETPNTAALSDKFKELGVKDEALVRLYRLFNANSTVFKEESLRHEKDQNH